ncbi:MAG: hypothetical protein AB1894_21390 [Chloroflexota bacterium]
MSKIFVRERTRVGRGEGRPRFVIVAVEGIDLKVYTQHIRKTELDALAQAVGAEVVHLPRGEQAEGDGEHRGDQGGRRRRKQRKE